MQKIGLLDIDKANSEWLPLEATTMKQQKEVLSGV